MLRAYADENVIFAVVEALRRRGMDVVTVRDRGRLGASDSELLDEAFDLRRVVLTNDTDFLVLARDRGSRGESFAPVFFWPQRRRESVGDLANRILNEASGHDYAAACSRVFFL
ncbi:MAG TPA: DUF5615 family PIN-like protein [Thermoguttaceae bacterium]|nr:DUF5615 family PIN-like protein [Thermoguttaceae bacterium]